MDSLSDFLKLAVEFIRQEDFNSALVNIEQAIERDGESSEALVLKGICQSQLRQSQSATLSFRKAISLDTSNVKAYFNFAVHLYALGHYVEAEDLVREAVNRDPSHVGARELHTKILKERDDRELTKNFQTNTTSELKKEFSSSIPGTTAPSHVPYYSPIEVSSEPVHSVAFVARLGKKWDAAGFILNGTNIFLGIVVTVLNIGDVSRTIEGMNKGARMTELMQAQSGISTLFVWTNILIALVVLTWKIIDIADRRSSWAWLLPSLLCCCCFTPGVTALIYQISGRGTYDN